MCNNQCPLNVPDWNNLLHSLSQKYCCSASVHTEYVFVYSRNLRYSPADNFHSELFAFKIASMFADACKANLIHICVLFVGSIFLFQRNRKASTHAVASAAFSFILGNFLWQCLSLISQIIPSVKLFKPLRVWVDDQNSWSPRKRTVRTSSIWWF